MSTEVTPRNPLVRMLPVLQPDGYFPLPMESDSSKAESMTVTTEFHGGLKRIKMGEKIEVSAEVKRYENGSMTIILPSGREIEIDECDTKPSFWEPQTSEIRSKHTASKNLNLEHLDHLALIVNDLEESLKFYKGALGLKQEKSPTLTVPVAWLSLGTHIQLHLVESDAANAEAMHDINNKDINNHIALKTIDLDATVDHLISEEYKKVTSLEYNAQWKEGTKNFKVVELTNTEGTLLMRQIIIRDPNGHTIELCECNELRKKGY